MISHNLLAVDLRSQYAFSSIGDKPINSVGDVISFLLPHAYQVAAVGVVFYFLIAATKLILSGGEKEAVASARAMITHAIIALVMLIIVFVFLQFLFDILGLKGFNIIP